MPFPSKRLRLWCLVAKNVHVFLVLFNRLKVKRQKIRQRIKKKNYQMSDGPVYLIAPKCLPKSSHDYEKILWPSATVYTKIFKLLCFTLFLSFWKCLKKNNKETLNGLKLLHGKMSLPVWAMNYFATVLKYAKKSQVIFFFLFVNEKSCLLEWFLQHW